MTHDQIMQIVKAIAKSYWCPFCLERSVAAMCTSGPYALQRFRSCRVHHDRYQQKRCPCGKPWAHCSTCMDSLADPRASADFYVVSASSASFCACHLLAAAPASPQPSSPEDDLLASDSYLCDIPHH